MLRPFLTSEETRFRSQKSGFKMAGFEAGFSRKNLASQNLFSAY